MCPRGRCQVNGETLKLGSQPYECGNLELRQLCGARGEKPPTRPCADTHSGRLQCTGHLDTSPAEFAEELLPKL